MPDYLLTVTSQQKNKKSYLFEIEDVLFWIKSFGVRLIIIAYEDHGLYNQLHCHCMVRYSGKYGHLTQWGDLEHTNSTYQIHWKRIVRGGHLRVINYLLKQESHLVKLRATKHITERRGGPDTASGASGELGGGTPRLGDAPLINILHKSIEWYLKDDEMG